MKRNPLRILMFIVTSTCLSGILYGQVYDIKNYRGELNIEISTIDEKRLSRGIELLNEAALEESQTLKSLELMDDNEKLRGVSSEYRKSVKQLIESSEKYREGHTLIETVFNENCRKFEDVMKKMNHYAAGINKAKYYEMKANTNIKYANSIRDIILEADKSVWIQYKMAEALELEKLAIRDRGRALQIYQDFPVEYNYGWDDDVTPEQVEKAFGDHIVNRPPENLFVQKPKEKKDIPADDTTQPFIPIKFKVQIAAHTEPIEKEYLEIIYQGNEAITESHTDMWYRYSIGNFYNFKEAEELLNRCGVRRAFIVAYQGEKKLTIKKALELIKENQ